MPFKVRLVTKGFEEYFEALQKAGKDIDAAADKALLTGAKVVQVEMQRLAPVLTGNLKDHIKIKGPVQDGNEHYIEVGVIHDLAFTDKRTAIYAAVQEYGSSDTPAHPYIRPGIDYSKREAIKAMKTSLIEDGLL
jgi:HK97 gp10 family phage protein